MELIQRAEQFFFDGMPRLWVAGGKEVEVPRLPEEKVYEYVNGDLVLRDRYGVSPTRKSAGRTSIYNMGDLIWDMYYRGYYHKRAMPIVKATLMEAYETRSFVGGRGVNVFIDEGLQYFNLPSRNEFASFKGREEVLDLETGESLGYHEYWGMSLI